VCLLGVIQVLFQADPAVRLVVQHLSQVRLVGQAADLHVLRPEVVHPAVPEVVGHRVEVQAGENDESEFNKGECDEDIKNIYYRNAAFDWFVAILTCSGDSCRE